MKILKIFDTWQFWLFVMLLNLPFALSGGNPLNVLGLMGASLMVGVYMGEGK